MHQTDRKLIFLIKFKSIEFEMSPNMRKEILNKDLKKVFTQHQLYVYNHMKNNAQLLIEGPSGT